MKKLILALFIACGLSCGITSNVHAFSLSSFLKESVTKTKNFISEKGQEVGKILAKSPLASLRTCGYVGLASLFTLLGITITVWYLAHFTPLLALSVLGLILVNIRAAIAPCDGFIAKIGLIILWIGMIFADLPIAAAAGCGVEATSLWHKAFTEIKQLWMETNQK